MNSRWKRNQLKSNRKMTSDETALRSVSTDSVSYTCDFRQIKICPDLRLRDFKHWSKFSIHGRRDILRAFPSEFWGKPNLNLVQVQKMWFRDKSESRQPGFYFCCSCNSSHYGEDQSVDVTNKGMVNRYLRVFTMFYATWCATGLHLRHTCPSRYLNS